MVSFRFFSDIVHVRYHPSELLFKYYHLGFFLLKQVFKTVADIYRDHVSEPLYSIYQELVKGRLDVTDRKARLDAIESLKRMIRAWLDENHPQMKSEDRASLAEAMDISLIEQHMECKIRNSTYTLNLCLPHM